MSTSIVAQIKFSDTGYTYNVYSDGVVRDNSENFAGMVVNPDGTIGVGNTSEQARNNPKLVGTWDKNGNVSFGKNGAHGKWYEVHPTKTYAPAPAVTTTTVTKPTVITKTVTGKVDYQKIYDYINKTVLDTIKNIRSYIHSNVNSQFSLPYVSSLGTKNYFAEKSDQYCWIEYLSPPCKPGDKKCVNVGIRVCIPAFNIIPADSQQYIKNKINQTVDQYNGDIWDFVEDQLANLWQTVEIDDNYIYKDINKTIKNIVDSFNNVSDSIKALYDYIDTTVAAGVLTAEDNIINQLTNHEGIVTKAVNQWMIDNNISIDTINSAIDNYLSDYLTKLGLTKNTVIQTIKDGVADYLRSQNIDINSVQDYISSEVLKDTADLNNQVKINTDNITSLQNTLDQLLQNSSNNTTKPIQQTIINNYTIQGITKDQIKELIKENLPKQAEPIANAIINWFINKNVDLNNASQVIPFVNEIKNKLNTKYDENNFDISRYKKTILSWFTSNEQGLTFNIDDYKDTVDSWIDEKLSTLGKPTNLSEATVDQWIANYVKKGNLDLSPYADQIYNLIKDKIPRPSVGGGGGGSAPIRPSGGTEEKPTVSTSYNIEQDKDKIIGWIDAELAKWKIPVDNYKSTVDEWIDDKLAKYSIDITKYKDTILSWINNTAPTPGLDLTHIQDQIDNLNVQLSDAIATIPKADDFFKWMSQLDLSKWYSLKSLWIRIMTYCLEPDNPITKV